MSDCQQLRDMAHRITDRLRDVSPRYDGGDHELRDLRERFANLLLVASDAMRAVELVDAGDLRPGAEMGPIRVFLGERAP
jgi:hypothetical protein